MSTDVYVTITHGGTTLATHVYVQLDTVAPQEASYLGGESPYLLYEAFLLEVLPLHIGDLLTDLGNIDPKTMAHTKYRVHSDPEAFPDQHMELYVERVIGT